MKVAVVALTSVLSLPENSALVRHANPSIAAGAFAGAFAGLIDAGRAEFGSGSIEVFGAEPAWSRWSHLWFAQVR
jgi:hypothetical protein